MSKEEDYYLKVGLFLFIIFIIAVILIVKINPINKPQELENCDQTNKQLVKECKEKIRWIEIQRNQAEYDKEYQKKQYLKCKWSQTKNDSLQT